MTKIVANLATVDSISATLDNSVLQLYAQEAMNEVKTTDHAHGAKLPHKILQDFFQNQAPKFNTLAAVEHALAGLYKKNNIEFVPQGIKQVVSNYKKRVKLAEEEIIEVSMTSDEKKLKDKIVLQMKKNSKEYRRRFKDKDVADMQNVATTIVKVK
jgi:hypothetical protein